MDVRGHWRLIAVAWVAASAAACDDSEDPPPTFTEVREQVFAQSCVFSTCHQGASPAGGLALDGNPIGALVGADSLGVPGRMRVVAGDPDGSYLMEKLEAEMPEVGDPMPPTAPLSADRVEMVRAWIEAGAADD